jgi:hypothetical protein
MPPAEIDIEKLINEWFATNYERLRSESGHALAPYVRDMARRQVLSYWQKLRTVAEAVTQTEVRLTLPNCHSPGGREFCIEGVVDIVSAEGKTAMYDLKTHDAEAVRKEKSLYERQLDVYAYIWQGLQRRQLDSVAVIATRLPPALVNAMRRGDKDTVEREFARWNPLVELQFRPERVKQTIADFGAVVDDIEYGHFQPATPEELDSPEYDGKKFAVNVCRNCDARYSCDSYRRYVKAPGRKDSTKFGQYFDDLGDEDEREDWRSSALPVEGFVPSDEPYF